MKKTRKRKRRSAGRVFAAILIVILVLLIAAAGGAGYGAYKLSQMETNYPGVSIDGMDVSGLTRDETVSALNAAGWQEKINTPISVTTIGGYSFELEPLKAGTGVPAEELADAAYMCGRTGTIIDSLKSYVSGWLGAETSEIVSTGRTADRAYIADKVDKAIAEVVAQADVEEFVVDKENGELRVKKGAGQISLDRNDFVEAVAAAMENGKSELNYEKLAAELVSPDFAAIYDELPHEAVNASFSDDGRFQINEETVAYDFDVAEAERIWNEAKPSEDIVITMDVEVPEVTAESLESTLFCDLLGKCTSYYPNSNDNRRSNLRLATSKIDGLVMYPGDLFSYNTVVGARTEEAGFLPAAAYVNGEEKEEIGGGACQVSSTLYSATLFAFLETVERENHYFAVTYLQMGVDATVTIPTDGGRAIDFKFRNNRNYPIKLVGYCDNDESSITFEIWGTLEEDDYMPIRFDNTYKGQFPSDVVLEKADPDRPGYEIQLSHDTYSFADDVGAGYRTVTWRRVIDESGTVVFEEMTNLLNDAGQHTMDTYYFHSKH